MNEELHVKNLLKKLLHISGFMYLVLLLLGLLRCSLPCFVHVSCLLLISPLIVSGVSC